MTERRPWWMTVAALVSLATLLVTFTMDMVSPSARAVEVWGGFEITGPLALATAPIHWAIFAFFAWGFWTGRMWVVPWAAAYVFYGAACHVVWSEVSARGRGWPIGLLQALGISFGAVLLLRAWRVVSQFDSDC
jgi:hypothetical protein